MDKISFTLNNKDFSFDLRKSRCIFITGQFLSSATGIKQYWSEGGLYCKQSQGIDKELTRSISGGAPLEGWSDFTDYLSKVSSCEPTKSHQIISTICNLMPAENIMLIQQSIESFHKRSGFAPTLCLNGSISELVCYRCEDDGEPSVHGIDQLSLGDAPPTCPSCSGVLRPNIHPISTNTIREHVYQVEKFIANGLDAIFLVGITEISPKLALQFMEMQNRGLPIFNVNPKRYKYNVIRNETSCDFDTFFSSVKIS